MLKFPDISTNNSVSGMCQITSRPRQSKGLSSWFPGAETLDIMPIIEELDEPREPPNAKQKKFAGKMRRRSSIKVRSREMVHSRRGSLTPVQRVVGPQKVGGEPSAKLDRRPIPKIKSTSTKSDVDMFDIDKFVRSLDKISLPKVTTERPSSSSSLISKYSNASSGSSSSTYARSDVSAVTLRDIDTATLEPEDSISRRGNLDTSVLDLDDDDMADFADDVAIPYATPLRFGATLSKEASMAMLMEYEDVVKTNIQIRSSDVAGSAKQHQMVAPSRGSPVPLRMMSPEEVYFNQRQVNRKMQKAMSLLDRVKQIEQENVASPGRMSPQSKWGRYW
ncbi:hypothetical protein LSH36_41g10018 [Paralvinella palmiformis]|uniref:Uncharacterized protein n=1 Tax=Paralvinella palmiformis TaxID=53620 RepID=A0AAD9K774_9ANNE|nr:hypothetical protein LSH36_41g10018 [Paralvinella palmiformis]